MTPEELTNTFMQNLARAVSAESTGAAAGTPTSVAAPPGTGINISRTGVIVGGLVLAGAGAALGWWLSKKYGSTTPDEEEEEEEGPEEPEDYEEDEEEEEEAPPEPEDGEEEE